MFWSVVRSWDGEWWADWCRVETSPGLHPRSTTQHPPILHHTAYTLRLQTHQLEMIPREARTQPPPASQPHTVRVSQILPAHVFYTNGQFCVLQIYSVSCISKVSIMCPKYFRIPLKYPCFVKIDGAQKIISNAWKMSPRLKIFPVFRNIPQIWSVNGHRSPRPSSANISRVSEIFSWFYK